MEIEQETALTKAGPPPSLMSVIERLATNPDVDIDKLARLLEMQRQWEAKQAEMAYNKAFAAFKAEAVNVARKVTYTDGPLKGKRYTDLGAVVEATAPLLSKFGLSASWGQPKDEPQWIEVTCVLRHELGHSESVSMGGPPDAGPARNAIQARASAVSYLRRYTLLAITGLATEDDDGNGGKRMEDDDLKARLQAIKTAPDMPSLKNVYLAAKKAALDAKDSASLEAFTEAGEARKKELTHA